MRRFNLAIPLSIVLLLGLTLVGTYYVRKYLLERTMLSAMEMNDVGMIRRLAESWPSPAQAQDSLGATPLHWAADHNDPTLAAMLLDHGADVNAFAHCRHDGLQDPSLHGIDFFEATTPLHRSLCRSHWDMARLLVRRGADVNLATGGCGDGNSSYAPLELAVPDADADFVEFLIRSGAKVECGNQFHWPLALAFNNLPVMQILVDHGADIEESGVDDYTTLDCAVFDNEPAATRFLLEHGAKVESFGGGTRLHLAAYYGHVECAEALLAHGADVTIKDKDGKTPLMMAEEIPKDGYPEVAPETRKAMVDLLRKHGAKE